MRRKQDDTPDFQDLEAQAVGLIATIDTLRQVYGQADGMERQLVNCRIAACTIAKYARALPTLLQASPDVEVMILDRKTGKLRKATHQEMEEIILDKKTGDILDLVNQWSVTDEGDWMPTGWFRDEQGNWQKKK